MNLEWLLLWTALMRISQSPSRITQFTPISMASSRALLAAKVSTSRTVAESEIYCEREANTRPSSFLITTPILAWFSWKKRAPSKFILTYDVFGVLYHCRSHSRWRNRVQLLRKFLHFVFGQTQQL